LEALEERLLKWTKDSQKIGDIILPFADEFKVYSVYITSFSQSQRTLKELMSNNKKFCSWLQVRLIRPQD
jgi:hypothetical protein